ncbi:hypothetical protein [Streptomyces sp. 1222.5]|uniref:hypothetical protein n=1 Tax=Streptomyces sp. 1222.5 TaxID=1881026 RepID=UPI003D73E29C
MHPSPAPQLAVRPYFDPFDPDLHADPYSRYAAARETAGQPAGARAAHRTEPDLLLPGHGPARSRPLRRIAARFFSPPAVSALAPTIATAVDDLREAALATAYPLSLRVVCGLFALPEQEQPWIREQTPPIARLLDPPYALTEHDLAAAHAAAGGFVAYLHRKINHPATARRRGRAQRPDRRNRLGGHAGPP